MKTIFLFTTAAIMSISLLASGQAKVKKNELNNKTFTITVTKAAEKKKASGPAWTSDEISFKTNKLSSKEMGMKEKFPPANFTETVDTTSTEKTYAFEATSKNPGGAELKWEGTVTGENIEGTATWSNKKAKQSFSFTGTLKVKEKKK